LEGREVSPVISCSDGAINSGRRTVAVRSTIVKLVTRVFNSDDYFVFPPTKEGEDGEVFWQGVRRVVYIDYKTAHPPLVEPVAPLCYKRKAFSYEQEVRGIRQMIPFDPSRKWFNTQAQAGPSVVHVPADMKELITAVYVPPRAGTWVRDLLRAVMDRYELKETPCHQSSLDDLREFGVPH
jgi:hypothetical protein